MIDALSDYRRCAESVIKENPIVKLEKYLENRTVKTADLLKIICDLRKNWKDNFSSCNIVMGVVLTEEKCQGSEIIYNYDFNKDISNIIQTGANHSNIYYLNSEYLISEIQLVDDLNIEKCSSISREMNKVLIHLGLKGIDIIINGTLYEADNFISSYKDMMDIGKMLEICDYKEIIKHFYFENIQYDPYKRYFLRKDDIPTDVYNETLKIYPKLLRNKPEQYFHMDFVKFLKNNCKDTVIQEYKTATGDRYDILVQSSNDKLYVFEIKWLGRSISTGMKVFESYNNEQRAISGAFQLLDYVSNSKKYSEYFLERQIFCAVLLIFDARDADIKINFPDEVLHIPNIDLSQRWFMEREKISASNVYANRKGR